MTRPAALTALEGEDYINLETFKRDGSGVKTPIWFVEVDGALYFFTNRESWKVKRLGRNPACKFAACGVRGAIKGPWFDGSAHLLQTASDVDVAYKGLRRKYGVQMWLADVGSKLIGSNAKRLFYRIDVSTGAVS